LLISIILIMSASNDRYSRQILFAGIGAAGQARLSNSRIAIIGCGALGCAQADMLTRAGIGFLRIIDRDFVELSNLHRQSLFDESDARQNLPKVVAAAQRLSDINPSVTIDARIADVNYANIEDFIRDVDIVIDATDNFETRYLINDAAVKLSKPWVYGAVVGAHGVQMTIRPGVTPCLQCIFPEPPMPGSTETCDTAGVILPIVATIASCQVVETLKLAMHKVEELHGSLIQFDIWATRITSTRLTKAKLADCPTCGLGNFEFLTARAGQLATPLCGRNAVQISPGAQTQLNLESLSRQLRNAGKVELNKYLLRLTTGDYEITVFSDARGIIRGTEDINVARSLYARYIGV
jgi:adenylyltransferase/sulfurtransferase